MQEDAFGWSIFGSVFKTLSARLKALCMLISFLYVYRKYTTC